MTTAAKAMKKASSRKASTTTKKTNTQVQTERSKPKAKLNMMRVAESAANLSQIETLSGGAVAVATDFVRAVDLA